MAPSSQELIIHQETCAGKWKPEVHLNFVFVPACVFSAFACDNLQPEILPLQSLHQTNLSVSRGCLLKVSQGTYVPFTVLSLNNPAVCFCPFKFLLCCPLQSFIPQPFLLYPDSLKEVSLLLCHARKHSLLSAPQHQNSFLFYLQMEVWGGPILSDSAMPWEILSLA